MPPITQTSMAAFITLVPEHFFPAISGAKPHVIVLAHADTRPLSHIATALEEDQSVIRLTHANRREVESLATGSMYNVDDAKSY